MKDFSGIHSGRLRSRLAMVVWMVCAAAAWGQTVEPVIEVPPAIENPAQRITGTLTRKDPFDKVRPRCHCQVHPLKAVPGMSYIIELHSDGKFRFDPFLRLEDAAGVQLMADDDSAGNRGARITFTPRTEETYNIIVTTYGEGETGAYILTIEPIPSGVPPPLAGRPVIRYLPVPMGDVVITPLPMMASFDNHDGRLEHGYLEYRFVVENRSTSDGHEVTLVMPRFRSGHRGGGLYLHSLRKTVQVGAGTTLQVSLFQPDLPLLSSGDVQVIIDGQERDETVSVQGVNWGSRYGMHYRHTRMGLDKMTAVLSSPGLTEALSANVYKSAVGGGPPRVGQGGFEKEPPFVPGGPGFPTPFSTIGSPMGMPAISGTYRGEGKYKGKYYEYFPGYLFAPASQPPAAWSRHWLGYSSYDGVALTASELEAVAPEIRQALWQYTEAGGTLLVVGACTVPSGWQRTEMREHGLRVYYPGFGKCIVSKESIAQLDPDAWRVITAAWEQSATPWEQVKTPSEAQRIFPVLEGQISIPVRGLFLFMLLFVVLIGPVNLLWLSWLRRRIWLLWTVPVFSLLTCAMLFGYMVISEGWHGHVRAEGLTVLDETEQRAASVGWLGFYSPTTPAGGLHFDADSELTPHFLEDYHRFNRNRQSCSIDWTEEQQFDTGWLQAKVAAHFLVRRNQKRLERVLVRKQGAALTAVNSLGVDVRSLWLADSAGNVFKADDVPAGAEAILSVRNEKAGGKTPGLREGYAKNWLPLLSGLETDPAAHLQPGCYVAIVDDLPFLQQGLSRTQTRKTKSVVFGIMKEPIQP